jgi:DNA-binding NarL/FixJ family response regulator
VDEPFVGRTAELAELRRQFELAMAQAAAAGKTNRQIAAELYISVKTVEFHLAQILARLDVDSRTEIARALAAPGA